MARAAVSMGFAGDGNDLLMRDAEALELHWHSTYPWLAANY